MEATEVAIKRFDNIGIACKDAKRTHQFYTEMLGCEAERLAEGATSFGASIADVAFYIFETSATNEVCRDNWTFTNPVCIDHLAFDSDDYEATLAELESKGVTWVGDSVGDPGGFRYRAFPDPDGNMIYVIHKG
jgi:catechol 2,3-dioxygenase-like lactoylglutathione lyase family enzyme